MTTINGYLDLLQEQKQKFNLTASLAGIRKKFKHDKESCRLDCYIEACKTAINDIYSLKTECSKAKDPTQCINDLNDAIDKYQEELRSVNDAQSKLMSK